MEVTTETLATMGAMLANGGISPLTGEKVFNAESGNFFEISSGLFFNV